jgi:hypothetical protein
VFVRPKRRSVTVTLKDGDEMKFRKGDSGDAIDLPDPGPRVCHFHVAIARHQQDHRFLSNFSVLLSTFWLVNKRKRSYKSNKSHKQKSNFDSVVINEIII